MKKLLLVVSIMAMWVLLACPAPTPKPSCIAQVNGDEENVTSVTISVNHCSSGTILPKVAGITVTNGTMDVLKITQLGKDDVYLSPEESTTLPNGEKKWKKVK